MDFDLSDEQKMLAEETRRLLSDRASANRLRVLADAGAAWDEGLWSDVAAMGLLGAAIPEELGGVGLGEIDVCVIAGEMGRGPAPLPFLGTVLAADAIRLAGSDAQKTEWLPKLASGETVAAYAWNEGRGAFHPRRMAAAVKAGRINGRKAPVADAGLAKIAIVAALENGEPGLFLVSLGDASVSPMKGFDLLQKQSAVTFDGAAAERLPGASEAFIEAMQDRAAIYTAFAQIGGAEACLYMARDYAMGRKTFGRPIAGYQAIKHKLAEVLVEIELARSNAYFAAWALANDAPELKTAAATARLSATTAYDLASRENLQVHGGFGYTWEADCNFHFRRARLLSAFLGGPDVWSARLIMALQAANAPLAA
ncbi:MAG: hypothetical protein JWP35_1277 [Caulobacter sp.]|nr:hypothetical protein [Caulobacter sp.]